MGMCGMSSCKANLHPFMCRVVSWARRFMHGACRAASTEAACIKARRRGEGNLQRDRGDAGHDAGCALACFVGPAYLQRV